jgi:hypothetical protein
MPIAPPRLRMTLSSAEADPVFSASMPAEAKAVSGVSTSAWPIARTMLGSSSWSAAMSVLRATFMKFESANRPKPSATM